jgi:hypothetical protein
MSTWFDVIVILTGLYAIAVGVFNWDWVMTRGRQARFVGAIGRTRARIVYVFLGLLLAGLGIAGAFGLIQ